MFGNAPIKDRLLDPADERTLQRIWREIDARVPRPAQPPSHAHSVDGEALAVAAVHGDAVQPERSHPGEPDLADGDAEGRGTLRDLLGEPLVDGPSRGPGPDGGGAEEDTAGHEAPPCPHPTMVPRCGDQAARPPRASAERRVAPRPTIMTATRA